MTAASPLAAIAIVLALQGVAAQAPARGADRAVYLDKQGVVRWKDDRREVALFGANYVLPTASDYRAAGYIHGDRKRMIEEDMAQFARMRWDGIRLTFWGDWEASDSVGNLIDNDHLDLLDWLIAKARERGIYMLFSPIQLYNAKWPDALSDTTAPGFGRKYDRGRMGTDPAAIAAQANYLKQILQHKNRYTGLPLKDEPGILFIELVNEPWHHPEDIPGSVRYIDALTDAVRSTGCRKLIFYNVSQDFRIGEAILKSKADGLTFGWYPTGLNSGHELHGNYLRGVDAFPDMLRPELSRMPRIIYEFDSPDTRNGTMYPAMARTFRAVGGQMALMFAYDMQQTASRNLGWQTHYLSLAHTPRKAVSSMIAAEAMRRLPRMQDFGPYPRNNRFGDFRISPEENLGELVARDAFVHAGTTRSSPPDLAALSRIAGYGSSPVVEYPGEGVYFLDKVKPGIWRLEVYPDAVPIRDPFEPPNAHKIVTRAIGRSWPMKVRLPDLGETFTVQPLTEKAARVDKARDGAVSVTPGVYLLSRAGEVDIATLPPRLGYLGIREYHPPPLDSAPVSVQSLAASAYLTGGDAEIRVHVAEATEPDSVRLFVRRTAGDFYHLFPLRRATAYEYRGTVPARELRPGPYEFVVSRFADGSVTTFPSGARSIPWSWDYADRESWRFDVVDPHAPLDLLRPDEDAPRLAFTRIGDAGRRGLFSLGQSPVTGQPVFHLELPVSQAGRALDDYAASLVISERVEARGKTILEGSSVRVRLRGLGARQQLHLTLMEDDGTSWAAPLTVDSTWSEAVLPLSAFKPARGVLLPQGFPGEWNYWVGPAEGRGGSGDRLRLDHLERVQLSLRREEGVRVTSGSYGVEVEWIRLLF